MPVAQSAAHLSRRKIDPTLLYVLKIECVHRYKGSQRSFLIPNTLFRVGASAAVMTNKSSERSRAKYQLLNVVRIHLGADPAAYK